MRISSLVFLLWLFFFCFSIRELFFQHHNYPKDHVKYYIYLMWSVFLVYMENVDSESISLLERPVTEVAGKFPVTLIHAARVFQMFVSIVLISEHFSTTITLETLSRIWNKEKRDMSILQTSGHLV